jgi:hypothetical protein
VSKSVIASALHAALVLGASPTRVRAPSGLRTSVGACVPTARHAGLQFAALLDARVAEPKPTATKLNPALRTEAQGRQAGPDAPLHPMRTTSATDDIERLIDELAEFVLRQRTGRAQRWSVTLWLRASVLRDTCLTMIGQPGCIAIAFATGNAASLRRLHAGLEALQTRLRERLAVPALNVSIRDTRATQATEIDA